MINATLVQNKNLFNLPSYMIFFPRDLNQAPSTQHALDVTHETKI